MGLVDVIKVQIDRFANEVIGFTTSPVYRLYDNALDAWFWVIDVDLDTASSNPNANAREGLIAVPIADPSREVFAADIGTQVKLVRRVEDQRYVVSGLSKYANGTLSICLVTMTPCGQTLSTIGNPVLFGNTVPALNGGFTFGMLPFGTVGKFDASNTLIQLITKA
jgi:hypothetical protein